MGLQRGMAAGEGGCGVLPLCGTDFIVSSRHGSDDDHNTDFMMSVGVGGGVRKNL